MIGRPLPPPPERPTAIRHLISPGRFALLGIPFLSGRDFNEHDGPNSQQVIIINEAMAKQLFPNESPLGRTLITGMMGLEAEIGSLEVGKRADVISVELGGAHVVPTRDPWSAVVHACRSTDVRDVVVVGRPSERWGSEVVAVVQVVDDSDVSDEQILDECARHVARYKVPKAIVRSVAIQRSPSGKADYRWAKDQVTTAN